MNYTFLRFKLVVYSSALVTVVESCKMITVKLKHSVL